MNFNFSIEFAALASRWLKRKLEDETNMNKIQRWESRRLDKHH